MKKILLLLCLLPAAGFSQKMRLAGAVRFNASTLVMRDPQNSSRSPERTGYVMTPGFAATVTYPAGRVFLSGQLGYEERGTTQPTYYQVLNTPYVINVFDRFRCFYVDMLVRAQSKKGIYVAGGVSVAKPLNAYFRKNTTSSVAPPGSIIITPLYPAAFTFGITTALGFNVSGKTDIEANMTYDLSPALNRSDLQVFLRTYSFSVRYYFLRPADE